MKEGEQYAILTDIAGAEDNGEWISKLREPKTASPRCKWISKSRGSPRRLCARRSLRRNVGVVHPRKDGRDSKRAAREVSANAPRIYTLQIPVDKIRDVIGPGGKIIRSIIEQTGVKIDVEDSGKVNVASNDEVSANKALQSIKDLTA